MTYPPLLPIAVRWCQGYGLGSGRSKDALTRVLATSATGPDSRDDYRP
ncbi:MAG: hypothetical protein JO082_06935 [Mycobacterium sp.]|nr:hypothetical protein [Mycobacterium sp.]